MDETKEEWPAPPEGMDTGEHVLAWIEQGGLEGWKRLWLGEFELDVDDARALAALPGLRHLTALNLTIDGGDAAVCPLLTSPYLAGLRDLDLDGASITVTSALTLANTPVLANVMTLLLGNNELGDEGVVALAASPVLRRLVTLGLHHNGIGDAGVQALALSPLLARLTTLDIHGNQFTEVGIQALAASPYLANLTWLDICTHHMSELATRAVVTSPHLRRLTTLCCLGSGEQLDVTAIEQLRRRYGAGEML